MSKNRLRGITLVRGPIWGIHFLTLIISWPKAPVALTSEEFKILCEKGLLGTCSTEALLNTLWLNNTLHFGLRGCKEHRDMCWGDLKLHKTANGEEYLESMKDKRKLELAQTTAMSELYRRKCLRPTKQKKILSRSKIFCQEETRGNESRRCSLLSGRKQRFKGGLTRKKKLIQVRCCWRKQTQRFNEDNGSKSRNLKRQASKSQRQEDNDPEAKWK